MLVQRWWSAAVGRYRQRVLVLGPGQAGNRGAGRNVEGVVVLSGGGGVLVLGARGQQRAAPRTLATSAWGTAHLADTAEEDIDGGQAVPHQPVVENGVPYDFVVNFLVLGYLAQPDG